MLVCTPTAAAPDPGVSDPPGESRCPRESPHAACAASHRAPFTSTHGRSPADWLPRDYPRDRPDASGAHQARKADDSAAAHAQAHVVRAGGRADSRDVFEPQQLFARVRALAGKVIRETSRLAISRTSSDTSRPRCRASPTWRPSRSTVTRLPDRGTPRPSCARCKPPRRRRRSSARWRKELPTSRSLSADVGSSMIEDAGLVGQRPRHFDHLLLRDAETARPAHPGRSDAEASRRRARIAPHPAPSRRRPASVSASCRGRCSRRP